MAISIGGLGGIGFDTAALTDQLIQIESRPQILLQNQVSSAKKFITGLQSLNAKVATLAESAAKLAKPESMALFKVTSSSEALTATAGVGASSGTVDVVVDKVAQAQSSVTAAMTAWAQDPPVLTLTDADGTATEITAASTSLDDVVTAINAADKGVTAMKVRSGSDIDGNPTYRLQVTAEETGAAGAFTLHAGTAAQVADGTATDVFAQTGAAHIRTAQDAEVKLWAGTAAEQTITSSTNTFENLVPGVDVTVSKVSTEPVTLGVTADTKAASDAAKALVDSLSSIFSLIATNSKVTTSTTDGKASTSAGVFAGDSTVRDTKQRLLTAATDPVNGLSPYTAGIEITRDGTVTFDEAKFAESLAKDPDLVNGIVQAVAGRVAEAAKVVSDKYDGTLTGRITSEEKTVARMNTEITDWDRRLEMRRSTLNKVWVNLEVQMQKMNSQGTWLSGQIASLPNYSQNGNK